MAMGSDGKLYVSDFYDGQVMRFDPANNYSVETFAGAANLWGSNGNVFNKNGNLNVVGMMSNNVYQFASNGAPVGELVPAVGGGLNFPSDIVIDPDGNLLVSSMGDDKADPPISGYIGKYNPTSGAAINQSFIAFGGPNLVQPTAMLIEPYAVWTGGAAGVSWKNAENWGGSAPADPAAIRFGAVIPGGHISNFNNFDPGTNFNGITFASDAPSYTLQGNAIKLGGPVINQSAYDQAINLDMELSLGGGSFDTGNKILTISGAISGSGSLIKKGSGTLNFIGAISYSGETTIDQGTLEICTPASTQPTVTLSNITGTGNLVVGDGVQPTNLTVDSIHLNIVTLGVGSRITIKPLPGGPMSSGELQSVPEPSTATLAMAGWLFLLGFQLWRCKK